MRLTRAALTVAAGALAPALLLSTPSSAAQPAPSPAATTTAPDAGLDGESPYDSMSEEELRVEIARILADPESGKGVLREAREAMDGTIDDMRYFLKTGLAIAQEEDDRFAIAQILADPNIGKAVYREAQKAMDGTAEDVRYFLETGLAIAQEEDDRFAIAQILADPNIGKAVYREAQKAMDG
ncbi:ALF repeat-containing protein, partial [Streptomyces sp. NPDC056099]